MAFEGFDLMIRDKFNNSICVGDKFKHILFDEVEGKIIENKGQIIYSPKYYCFAIVWEDTYIDSLSHYTDNFWKGVEKCQ